MEQPPQGGERSFLSSVRGRQIRALLALTATLAAAAALLLLAARASEALASYAFGGSHTKTLPPPLLAWLLAEAAFYCCCFRERRRELNAQPRVHAPADLTHESCSAVAAAYVRHLPLFADDPAALLTPWFHGAPLSSIGAGNLAAKLAAVFFYSTVDEMEASGRGAELAALTQRVQLVLGIRLEPGFNPRAARFMAHLRDDLPAAAVFPLALYALAELAAVACAAMLLAAGFRRRSLGGMRYYTFGDFERGGGGGGGGGDDDFADDADTNHTNTSKLPVVFLHGVGAGLFTYVHFVIGLTASNRPLLLPQQRHVAMRYVRHALPSVTNVADAAAAMLARHGVTRAAVVAHSYGTAVAALMLRRHAGVVAAVALLDPICFAMFMPQLQRNFVYEMPRSGHALLDGAMRLASRELHCAAAFCRNFYWSEINLFEDAVPDRHCLVALSGADVLCPASKVALWLQTSTRASVLYDASMPHAGFLIYPSWHARVDAAVEQLIAGAERDEEQQDARRAKLPVCSSSVGDGERAAAGAAAAAVEAAAAGCSGGASSRGSSEDGMVELRLLPPAAPSGKAAEQQRPVPLTADARAAVQLAAPAGAAGTAAAAADLTAWLSAACAEWVAAAGEWAAAAAPGLSVQAQRVRA